MYSPCDAKVIEVESTLVDFIPREATKKDPLGNYVGLSCKNDNDTIVYLAYLSKNSVLV